MFRYAKELLLIVYLLLYSEYYIERLNAIGVSFSVLLFGAMFLALTLALYLTAYIRQALIRHLFAIALFVSAVFFDVYTRVTADYLSYVLNRITLPGSIYLGVIAVLPNLFLQIGNSGSVQNLPFGGTAVLIMIGVGLDTVKQIESQLMQRNYEGFLK